MKKTDQLVNVLKILKKCHGKYHGKTMLGDMSLRYDPFKLLISTILSARSRDEVTYPVAENLFKSFPDAKALASADIDDIKKIIQRIGFYNQKSWYIKETAGIILKKYRGKVPQTMEELTALPGVGRKVAGCVMVYAFQKDAIPVDTHVHRVSNRLGIIKTQTPERSELALMKVAPKKYWQDINELFVWHGKTTCKPGIPDCFRCSVLKFCNYKNKNI